MAYKDPRAQKAASQRHYKLNKQKYLERNKRYREEIRRYMRDIKEAKPCLDCGKKYPYYVMDFDHLENKKNLISFLASTGRIGALKAEVEKCEVVCANCHRQRSYKRLQQVRARSSAD